MYCMLLENAKSLSLLELKHYVPLFICSSSMSLQSRSLSVLIIFATIAIKQESQSKGTTKPAAKNKSVPLSNIKTSKIKKVYFKTACRHICKSNMSSTTEKKNRTQTYLATFRTFAHLAANILASSLRPQVVIQVSLPVIRYAIQVIQIT